MLLKLAAYAAYAALAGYLVVNRLDQSFNSLVLYTLAMLIHLLGVAHRLRHFHERVYDRLSRWVLVGSLFAGWTAATLSSLPERFVALWVSFLAGALVIMALRGEMPRNRDVRYLPFVGGATAFSVIALLAERL